VSAWTNEPSQERGADSSRPLDPVENGRGEFIVERGVNGHLVVRFRAPSERYYKHVRVTSQKNPGVAIPPMRVPLAEAKGP
jgi:hypothetical protein